MLVTLRPDQQAVKNGIYGAWNDNDRVALAIATTGWGKSKLMSDIALDIERSGLRNCIMAHRKELVGQMAMHIAQQGIPHRIIGPKEVVADIAREQREELGRSFVNPDARAAVASVDTIVSRSEELAPWARSVQYFMGDEGHHYLRNNKWGKALDLFTTARGLLVTACPERADGQGLGRHADGYADRMILGPTMRETIELGGITDYEIAVPDSDFEIDENARGKDGDFTTGKMREASRKSHIVGDVVQEYTKRAYGKRAICFATDVETAGEIAQKFNDAGVPAIALSGKTPSNVRREMIKRFKSGQIWVLVNVDLFDEGFDVPACEVVIMARPTASLNKYLQMFGRALRTMVGKLYGLIIDHVSNWKRHGLPDRQRFWTMDRREKQAKKEKDPEFIEDMTVCKGCSRPYELFHPACPYCGHEPVVAATGGRAIEQIAGDLRLLDRETLAQMRADMELESPASVAERVAFAAGPLAGRGAANRQIEKHQAQQRLFDAVALWAGIQRAKGRSDAESYRRFYLTTGVNVLGAMHKDRSRQDYDALTETVESWITASGATAPNQSPVMEPALTA